MHIGNYEGIVFKETDLNGLWWESGAFIIPSQEWADYRRDFLEMHNEQRRKWFSVAEELYAEISAQMKSDDNPRQLFLRHPRIISLPRAESYTISKLLFQSVNDRLYQPKRHSLGLTNKYDRDVELLDGAWMYFDVLSHVVRWHVRSFMGSGLHDIDYIRRVVTRLIDVKWVRGTGGVIYSVAGNAGFGPLGESFIGSQKER
jgi:hypothetical protein